MEEEPGGGTSSAAGASGLGRLATATGGSPFFTQWSGKSLANTPVSPSADSARTHTQCKAAAGVGDATYLPPVQSCRLWSCLSCSYRPDPQPIHVCLSVAMAIPGT